MRVTGLCWPTVSKAQYRLVTAEVARLLAKFSRGKVKAREMERESRSAKAVSR